MRQDRRKHCHKQVAFYLLFVTNIPASNSQDPCIILSFKEFPGVAECRYAFWIISHMLRAFCEMPSQNS